MLLRVMLGLGISVMMLTSALPYSAVASVEQSLHNQTLEEIVKQKDVPVIIPQIDSNSRPENMYIDNFPQDTNRMYVSEPDSEAISIISTENHTKIKDIRVEGSPKIIENVDLYLNNTKSEEYLDTIFVSSRDTNNIFVISTEDNTKIKDIEVGEDPDDIARVGFYNETNDTLFNKVYVANSVPPWTVSVILNDTKVKDIVVVDPEGEAGLGDIETVSSENTNSSIDKVYVTSSNISVISVENDTKIKDIEWDGPIDSTKLEHAGDKMYVSGLDSVSVISVENDTKIKDIETGGDINDIESNFPDMDKLYVAKSVTARTGTISVISVENDTKIKDIVVGDDPRDIEIESFHNEATDEWVDTVYVANSDSDTISVISGENDTKIKDIKVGNDPSQIRVHDQSNTIYVANQDFQSGLPGISVINGVTNKVVARVTYDINPSNAGQIICNGLTSPLNRYFYVSADTECVAQSNKGFEFSSWVENFGDNSTRTIKATAGDDNILEPLLDFLNIKPEDPTATLNNIQFGNFTANFNKLPSPIPSEYLIPLYGIIITTIVGWSIPGLVRWLSSKSESRRMNRYHMKIVSLFNDGKIDENDIISLDNLGKSSSDAYSKGKISELHYERLKNEISVLYDEMFKKRIASCSLSGKDKKEKAYDEIKNDIEEAYSKGKITELHYNLLNKKIESFANINNNKTSDDKHANKTGITKRSPL